jgi:hypothetical protein
MPPHTRSAIPDRSLLEFAASRMITLFPGSELAVKGLRVISELHAKSVAEQKPASVDIIKPVSARCTIRACPFPSYEDGKCRQHNALGPNIR